MNKQVIAVIIGVIVVLVIGFFVWRFVSSRIASDNNNDSNEAATADEIAVSIGSIVLSEDAQFIVGQTVSVDRNKVVAEVAENTFWLAPLGGDKNLILVNSAGTAIAADNIISFSGQAKNVKDYADASMNWKLSRGDLEIIKTYPLVIDATTIEIVN